MSGIRPNRSIYRILSHEPKVTNVKTLDLARAQQVLNISELQTALDQVHKDVELSVTRRREKAIASHNKATNIISPTRFARLQCYLTKRRQDRTRTLRTTHQVPRFAPRQARFTENARVF